MSSAVRSSSSDTSAKSRAGRVAVPAKMTSSMPAPRIDLGELSPITQRIASSTLDLPQPLGPTTPVRPGSTRSSAASTKLLKPESFSRLICMPAPPSPWLRPRFPQCRLGLRPGDPVGLDPIDEEGRSPLHAQRLRRLDDLAEAVEACLVGEALAGARRRHAIAGGDRNQA